MIQPKLVKFRPFFFSRKTINVRELYLSLTNNRCYRLNFNFQNQKSGVAVEINTPIKEILGTS